MKETKTRKKELLPNQLSYPSKRRDFCQLAISLNGQITFFFLTYPSYLNAVYCTVG